jgi:hypothetical protein
MAVATADSQQSPAVRLLATVVCLLTTVFDFHPHNPIQPELSLRLAWMAVHEEAKYGDLFKLSACAILALARSDRARKISKEKFK